MHKQAVANKKINRHLRQKEQLVFFWDLYAICHDSLYGLMPYRKLLWDCLEALDLKPGMKLLNLGCGTGAFERFVNEKGIKDVSIEALESSPSRLRIAQKKYKNGYANYRLIKNIGNDLPYQENIFDAAISINVIPFLSRPSYMLEELRRVVKPEGNIVITKPKIFFKKLPIIFDHIDRFRNIKGITKKADIFSDTVKASSLLILNPILTSFATKNINKTNQLSEKDLIEFSRKHNFKNTEFSPTHASQGMVFKVNNKKEEVVYPIKFKIAQNNKDLEEIHKLRFNVYCYEKDYLEPEIDSLGIEKDEYDPYSTHFMAIDASNKLIGTSRLIVSPNNKLPAINNFAINNLLYSKKIAEKSRLIIKSNGRNARHKIALGLYKISVNYAFLIGYTKWLAILESQLFRFYRNILGFPFISVGEEKDFFGAKTGPYLLDLNDMMQNLQLVNNPLYEFFREMPKQYYFEKDLNNLLIRRIYERPSV